MHLTGVGFDPRHTSGHVDLEAIATHHVLAPGSAPPHPPRTTWSFRVTTTEPLHRVRHARHGALRQCVTGSNPRDGKRCYRKTARDELLRRAYRHRPVLFFPGD